MAYILNGTTLKNPIDFQRAPIKVGKENISLTGKTTEDIRNQKERYTLVFEALSAAERNAIVAIYELQAAVTFEVTETNLTIASTNVIVDIESARTYIKGGDYLENLTLNLTEVE